MKIVIGSTSDRKISVVKCVFSQYFTDQAIEVIGHNAISGVPETPYDEETYQGAKNRAKDCKKHHDADYYVGLESGLVERYGELYEEAWAYIINRDKEYAGYSSGLKVPTYITNRMKKQKLEHCDVMGLIEKEMNKLHSDTWGTYTGGAISREVSLEEAIRNSLIQIIPLDSNLFLKSDE